MALEKEIALARKRVVTDGYDMSIGEIVSLYKSNELKIAPEYQRLFRWEAPQKTRFIESLLLGIPTPPLFVSTQEDGTWELIDGLQRVSTLLQFFGELPPSTNSEENHESPLVLEGTELLPSLAGIAWKKAANTETLPDAIKLDLRRKRVRLEILKKESDQDTKYELFQRLNTGGTKLEPQEVRNCILVMLDRNLYKWFEPLAQNSDFTNTTDISESKLASKYNMELVLRYLALRHLPYTRGRDVHDYLDETARKLPTLKLERRHEKHLFEAVFAAWENVYGAKSFRVQHKSPQFSLAAFEVLSVGTSFLLEKTPNLSSEKLEAALRSASSKLWASARFKKFSGMGVRGSDRIFNLSSHSREFFGLD